jgi:hypothetical protein
VILALLKLRLLSLRLKIYEVPGIDQIPAELIQEEVICC